MKYLKLPYTGQYNSSITTYVPIDKITRWKDHCVTTGENHKVETDWTAEEIEKAIKEAEEIEEVSKVFDTYIEGLKDKSIEKLYVEGATSNSKGDEPKWEMRINGIPVEPQVGELEEVWKNVTVEVVRMPSGELSVGWRRQDDTKRVL